MISHRYTSKLPGSAPWVLYELLENPESSIGQLTDALDLGERTIERAVHDLVSRGLCVLNGRSVTLAQNWREIVASHAQTLSQGLNTLGTSHVQDVNTVSTNDVQAVNTPCTSLVTELTNTVQHEGNDSPSRERARISVSLSSLEPKKQIQTSTEKARKTRASKSSDPPEIPDALPDDLASVAGVPEAWAAFEKMRREHAKHPALTNFTRWRIWKLLRKFRAEGHDIEESVARSANKGWADVFRPDPVGSVVQQLKTNVEATEPVPIEPKIKETREQAFERIRQRNLESRGVMT